MDFRAVVCGTVAGWLPISFGFSYAYGETATTFVVRLGLVGSCLLAALGLVAALNLATGRGSRQ